MPSFRRQQPRQAMSRSRRVEIYAPGAYWPKGTDLSSATPVHTKNISRTGLYLCGEGKGTVPSDIEFELRLPAPLGSVLRGQATIVRHEPLGDTASGFGAKIVQYTLERDAAAVQALMAS